MKLGRLDAQLMPGAPTRIQLAGRIDDAVQFGDLIAQLPPGAVAVDTSDVTFVNSIGMREWIRFLRVLRDRGTPAILERVADVLMTQMNLITELRTAVQIVSFHAQYVCGTCGAEAAPVVDALANAAALRRLEAPRLPCPECNAQMELADFPERYLSIFKLDL
ncbi:MAG: hypothetical protein H0T79_20620 [Deltaproteobacteria bacterium]|nr:hypothetical protein [Deltaproteobacteria bacterium]